jgi:hypothetical protein
MQSWKKPGRPRQVPVPVDQEAQPVAVSETAEHNCGRSNSRCAGSMPAGAANQDVDFSPAPSAVSPGEPVQQDSAALFAHARLVMCADAEDAARALQSQNIYEYACKIELQRQALAHIAESNEAVRDFLGEEFDLEYFAFLAELGAMPTEMRWAVLDEALAFEMDHGRILYDSLRAGQAWNLTQIIADVQLNQYTPQELRNKLHESWLRAQEHGLLVFEHDRGLPDVSELRTIQGGVDMFHALEVN